MMGYGKKPNLHSSPLITLTSIPFILAFCVLFYIENCLLSNHLGNIREYNNLKLFLPHISQIEVLSLSP